MGVKVKSWKGAWWVFINHRGRRKAKRCTSKRAAELAAEKIDARLKLGEAGVSDDAAATNRPLPRKEYGERWFEPPVRPAGKGNTQALYRSRLELHWYPALGAVPVFSITRDM